MRIQATTQYTQMSYERIEYDIERISKGVYVSNLIHTLEMICDTSNTKCICLLIKLRRSNAVTDNFTQQLSNEYYSNSIKTNQFKTFQIRSIKMQNGLHFQKFICNFF